MELAVWQCLLFAEGDVAPARELPRGRPEPFIYPLRLFATGRALANPESRMLVNSGHPRS
jgi:hypothetical protein